jgi:aminoglycoside phosphotransferase (APT) family kinase protein
MMVELGKLLGKGKEAEVFQYGDHVLKLYKPAAPKTSAFREAANLAIAERLGLPAPIALGVQSVGERWGVAMTLAPGESFGAAMTRDPTQRPAYLESMVRLQVRIHAQPAAELASMKARLSANIERSAMLGPIRQRRLLEGLAALPEGDKLCHGDFHPWNILGSADDAVIVDWLDACRGDPAADVCRSYVLMRHSAPEIATAYVETYELIADEKSDDVFAWLPVIAAARLAEGVPHEVDELMELADQN